MVAPPMAIQFDCSSSNISDVTAGGPKREKQRDVSLNSADLPSGELKRHGCPKRAAKYSATSRTNRDSAPVTFSTWGGDTQSSSARNAYEFASRCQITLTAGTVRSTARFALTFRAISARTP